MGHPHEVVMMTTKKGGTAESKPFRPFDFRGEGLYGVKRFFLIQYF
jgi:hypothetical protein